MSIIKTKKGTWRVRKKFTSDVISKHKIENAYYDKTFKTELEAKQAELDFDIKLKKLKNTEPNVEENLNGGDMLFKDFFNQEFWQAYKDGLTTSYSRPPSRATVSNCEVIFRLHILPLFGEHSLGFLNENRQLVKKMMNEKAKEFANFKVVRSYFLQVIDLAEEYEYIEVNKLEKVLKKIKSAKKLQLKEETSEESKYLNMLELKKWFEAVEEDYQKRLLTMQDYTLFWLTFLLSDRKSETYALQWKHIDFKKSKIILEQALDRYATVKSTKGNKKTEILMSQKLVDLLKAWKRAQRKELAQVDIKQDEDQFLFTYCNRKGAINQQLHVDYLNRRMNAIMQRHTDLAHCTPHLLRHTSATLASQRGMSIEEISKGLTHSELSTTKIYINTHNVISNTPADYILNEINFEGENEVRKTGENNTKRHFLL